MKITLFLICSLFMITVKAQITDSNSIPYKEIPSYPADYGAGNLMSRLVDGLGYRYYWASEGLTESDLGYKPSDDSRSLRQTIEHINGLSQLILNTVKNIQNNGGMDRSKISFDELREATLLNFQESSQILLGMKAEEIGTLKIVFQRGGKKTEFPFWNLINGPIADALYHTGQVVSFRRASGNPINPKVQVFVGKNRQ